MNCPSCNDPLSDHGAFGCQARHWDTTRCECSSTREAVQESIEIYEREVLMEQRVKDMERGMYDTQSTIDCL